MRTYKIVLFLISFIFCSFLSEAQNHKFYIRATSQNFNPSLTLSKGELSYNGTDTGLKKVFNENTIYVFEKAFTHSRRSNLQRTWYIEGDSPDIVNQFLQFASHIFDYGEYLGTQSAQLAGEYSQRSKEELLIEKEDFSILSTNYTKTYNPINSVLFFPNDYGTTSPVPNLGLAAELDNFDFIGVPEAWEYTTGSSDIILGLSDAQILINYQGLTDDDPDFINKTTTFYNFPGTLYHGEGHGFSVGMRMAGQGNNGTNGTGSTGICYDCPIYATTYNNYDTLLALSYEGARVINCSWGGPDDSPIQQECIDEVVANGTIIVAASHNQSDYDQDEIIYPAAYDNVIAVGGINHKNDLILDNVEVTDSGTIYINGPKYFLGASVIYSQYPTEETLMSAANIADGSTSVLGDWVDIVAPGNNVFTYASSVINGDIRYTNRTGQATSASTPHVSGTIGLMLDVNQCLSFEQVESILKISSINIDYIQANLEFEGLYGAGSLHAGNAVKLVDALINPTKTAYLENQKFIRWDFEFKGVSEKIEIRNQEFIEGATLNVLAKNRILIEEGSLIEPNADGNALLEIDPSLALDVICDPPDDPGFADSSEGNETRQEELVLYKIYPTKVNSSITVEKIGEVTGDMSRIEIYDLFNRIVYTNATLESLRNNGSMSFDLSGLKRGIYIVKGYAFDNEEIITEKIIKE
ncbi:MAG: hypothetical protein ACI9Y7_000865 [Dokdonia sp.]|jgi:hypothetical protein